MGLFSRPETSILLVCTANICRSPMAEGVLRVELERRGLLGKMKVDSAGTHATQPGRAPDKRAQLVCQQHGIDIGKGRARQINQRDFGRFDHILAMDSNNYEWLLQACPESHRHKIALVCAWFEGNSDANIPDPYYGNQQGFMEVYTLLCNALEAFATRVLKG
jgi:low molecular weight protein-tyrosine phosphatase